jgi:hypothetical protein
MRGGQGLKRFFEQYLKHLEGKKIVKTGVSADGFPWFQLDDGSKCEISRDAEGNGPGWLFGLPQPH